MDPSSNPRMDASLNLSYNLRMDPSYNQRLDTHLYDTSYNLNYDTSYNRVYNNTQSKTLGTVYDKIVNKYGFFFFICFLAICFILYLSVGYENVVRNVDICFFGILTILILLYLILSTEIQKSNFISNYVTMNKDIVGDPDSFWIFLAILILFYIIVLLLFNGSRPISFFLIECYLWLLFLIIVIVNIFKYLFQIDLVSHFFYQGHNPIEVEESSESLDRGDSDHIIVDKREVFNVSNNLYTYEDAHAICKSYNATLATYDQVEKSYNDGGEWCNYGWSDNQMILYPTQKNTWNQLQQYKNHENDCGRPGVNGGYLEDKNAEFGVNCYGIKPDAKISEVQKMNTTIFDKIPKSDEDIIMDAKIQFWKENSNKLLTLNAFNGNSWNDN